MWAVVSAILKCHLKFGTWIPSPRMQLSPLVVLMNTQPNWLGEHFPVSCQECFFLKCNAPITRPRQESHWLNLWIYMTLSQCSIFLSTVTLKVAQKCALARRKWCRSSGAFLTIICGNWYCVLCGKKAPSPTLFILGAVWVTDYELWGPQQHEDHWFKWLPPYV